MLIFSGVSLYSGGVQTGQLIYWLVVAALCVFIICGRLGLKPF
jgi:hypothetical protein